MQKRDGCGVRVLKNGPYVVNGLPLSRQKIARDDIGFSIGWEARQVIETGEIYALCRCGKSGTKPFCDGTHDAVRFDGTETEIGKTYMAEAIVVDGPKLRMYDVPHLCAYTRHCHDLQGDAWEMTEKSDNPELAEIAKREARSCPSGRLVMMDKEQMTLDEPDYEPEAVLIADDETATAGPIWVKGGIQITSADGGEYEVRNRVTLCRCGQSSRKPYCDSSHIATGFREDR